MNKNITLLTLKYLNGIGNITAKKIMDFIGDKKIDLEELFKVIGKFPRVRVEGLGVLNMAYNRAVGLLNQIKDGPIKLITYFDKDYPKSLLLIKDLPVILFYVGDISLISQKCVAIVGTRKPSELGIQETYNLSQKMCKNYVIVSGLAEGIDIEAHKSCLDNKGKTVAILGQGINTINQQEKEQLCSKIITTGGLILSEYPPEQNPSDYTFIARNRLQSAVSDKVFIVETNDNGGTMHTARKAKEYNKELLVFESKSNSHVIPSGNRLLIQEGVKTFNEDY